ncbi:MAG: hypothetical protein IH971_08370 [Candidatus Marinimicrobia bacterium]|nr:hypothetical protein [Candidatus Neomarinimicrobiota bacterium]
MTYYFLLRMVHVSFVVFYVGAAASMAILWLQARRSDGGAEGIPSLNAVVTVGHRITLTAGSIALLAGILMIMERPSILQHGAVFIVKIILGVMAVGLSHMVQGRVRRFRDGAQEGTEQPEAEKSVDMLLKLAPVLALATVLLGVFISHG